MTTSDVLRQAAKLLSEGWCRQCAARDDRGEAVEPHDITARCWCAVGAVERVTLWAPAPAEPLNARMGLHQQAIDTLNRQLPAPWSSVMAYNDHPDRTQQEVLEVFAKALCDAEETEMRESLAGGPVPAGWHRLTHPDPVIQRMCEQEAGGVCFQHDSGKTFVVRI